MTRWKKDAKEFAVSVSRVEHRHFTNIPKPIIEYLDDPKTVTFRIEKNGKVTVS